VAEADGKLLSESLAQAGLAGARRPAVVSNAIRVEISPGLWLSVRIRATAMVQERADTQPWLHQRQAVHAKEYMSCRR